jgi:hypothetical protein
MIERAETIVVLIVFNDVLCNVSDCTAIASTIALHESSTRNALLGPWLSNTEVYLTPL